jgi:CelD/BcsL family acetyltransferase involved in cellulose biosynthesis
MHAEASCIYQEPCRTEILSGGIEVIDQLAPEWSALCRRSAHDAPFYGPEWTAAYLRAFVANPTVLVVTARQGGELKAVLALVREVGLMGGIPVMKLRAAGNVHTCRFDLVRSSDAVPVFTDLWNALLSLSSWDVLELPNVVRGSAAGKLARHAETAGCVVHATRGPTSPFLRLAAGAQAFEQICERTDPKFRANLRRRLRKLNSLGPVRITCTRTADEHLGAFYELECRGWKGTAGSAITCDRSTRLFYDELARRAEKSAELRLYTLNVADRIAAMHFAVQREGRYYLLKTAYDEALKAYSPGQILTSEVIRQLAREGCREFDFLGITTEWKRDWRPRLRPHANWYVFRSATGKLAHTLRFRFGSAVARQVRSRSRRRDAADLQPGKRL